MTSALIREMYIAYEAMVRDAADRAKDEPSKVPTPVAPPKAPQPAPNARPIQARKLSAEELETRRGLRLCAEYLKKGSFLCFILTQRKLGIALKVASCALVLFSVMPPAGASSSK